MNSRSVFFPGFTILIVLLTIFLTACGGGSKNTNIAQPRATIEVKANPGADRTGSATRNFDNPQYGEILFLNGLGSAGTSFTWQVVKQSVEGRTRLTSASTPITGFYAEKAGTYTLELTVADAGRTAQSTVSVTLIDDMDGDGLIDANDPDRDGDGFLNENDAFPDDRSAHTDTNNDGISNYATADVDGDGVDDESDDFPLDATRSAYVAYDEKTETGVDAQSSNQNDGITVAESAGHVPGIVNGSIAALSNRPDVDYFKLTFDTPGRYSVVLSSNVAAMRPSIALIDNKGAPVATTTANVPSIAGWTAISSLINSAGDYYLSVTDASGNSDPGWKYSIKIFVDSDLDGVPDDLEQAIGSNHLSADSDGDGISDFVEIQIALRDWANNKDSDGDGIPLWWDLDSDGDGIPDALEYISEQDRPDLSNEERNALNNVDGDAFMNFLDSDSDGNTLADAAEVGMNPTEPLDSDQDGIPDFMDTDDDNDGLLDANEGVATRLEALTPAASAPGNNMRIFTLENTTLIADDVARSGDNMILHGTNLPTDLNNVWILIRGAIDTLNLPPNSVDEEGIHFTFPVGITPGSVEIYLSSGSERSEPIDVMVAVQKTPVITGYSVDAVNGKITLTGVNLNASLTINFTGTSTVRDNSNGDPGSYSFYIPSAAQSGFANVVTSAGKSNDIWLELLRQVSGSVMLPSKSTVNVTDLDVGWNADEHITPAANGNFKTNINLTGSSIVTAVLEDPASTDENPILSPYLMALVLENDYSFTLSARSTALALVWSAINPEGLLSKNYLNTARNVLRGLPAVQDYGDLLETKLVENPDALLSPDTETQTAASAAILAAINTIQQGITDGTLAPQQKANSNLKSRAVRQPASITPDGMVDDIQITERENTGNVNVINDSALFLSAQVTAKSGALLLPHSTSFWNFIAPQGYGVISVSSETPLAQPQGRSSIVQIVTPGVGKEFEPKIDAPYNVWEKLTARTIVQQAFWPVFQIAVGVKMDPKAVTDIFMEHVFNASDVMIKLRNGQTKDAFLQIADIVKEDFLKQPPGSGPISKALITYLVKTYGKKFIIKKLGRMLAIKIIPIVGQIETAVNVGGHIQNATTAAKTIYDLSTTDAVIDYEVDFPPEIDEVIPGAVRASGKAQTFVITGRGFSMIRKVLAPAVFMYAVPKVTFTDTNGRSETVYPSMSEVERHDDKMTVQISGAFLDPDKLAGPLSVRVHHPEYLPDSFVDKADAVEVIDQLKITSISPDKVYKGGRATIYGAGFSPVITNNEVMIGGKSALISFANETFLQIAVPLGLDPGQYTVKARSMWNIQWSDWSNELPIEIIEGDVKITVTDSGGVKDDAFSLYVDGKFLGTMYASNADYSETYSAGLGAGPHTAMLLGVEAPDSIGTYSISFSGVQNLGGDARSGSDLVPGVRKYYYFEVSDQAAQKPTIRLMSKPYVSRVPDLETLIRY